MSGQVGDSDGVVSDEISASALLIGDELLSGRTRDDNLSHIASRLCERGVDLREARVVGDRREEIVSALNALRTRWDYVITTGGIGPTHDDITADSVASAFGVETSLHPDAEAMLLRFYGDRSSLTESRLRMARIPQGARLISNAVSGAPGFRIGNVFVLAGVPKIMRSMLDSCLEDFPLCRVMSSRSVTFRIGESFVASALAEAQGRHPSVAIGSYPFEDPPGCFGSQVVLRGRDESLLSAAERDVRELADRFHAESDRYAFSRGGSEEFSS